jgi:hypothetical protein
VSVTSERTWADRGFRALLAALYIAAAIAVLTAIWLGRDYYLTALAQRPFRTDYDLWRPSGEVSHGLGIAGSAMLLTLLLYSARKRTRLFGRAGRMSHWLNVHIFLGIWGPALVTLHTTFKVNGLVAVSYWSMMAVALSGVLGRFLYRQIPRTIAGQELSPAEAAERQRELDARLAALAPGADNLPAALDRLAAPPAGGTGRLLWWLLRRNLSLRRDIRREVERANVVPGPAAGAELDRIARERVLLARRRELGFQVQQVFHYWHVIHKPFAILMLVIMAVHIGISVWLGYVWFF